MVKDVPAYVSLEVTCRLLHGIVDLNVIMHLEQQRGIVLINCKEHNHSGSSYLKGWLG